MIVKSFSSILLLFSIKCISAEGYFHVIQNVNSITNGRITDYTTGQTRTSCILKCRHDENCDKAYFKAEIGDTRFGECWFVKEEEGYEWHLPQASHGDKMETFEQQGEDIMEKNKSSPEKEVVSYCEANKPCSYGTCENTNDATQYKCHCNSYDWKLQAGNVCFGARDDSYGNFTLRHTGTLTKLKLQHTGETTLNCYIPGTTAVSLWGCDYTSVQEIWTAVTDKNDVIICPNSNPTKYYYLSGYNGNSPYLEFDNIHIAAINGDELRIWYLPDLRGLYEHYRAGSSCADVYAVICD